MCSCGDRADPRDWHRPLSLISDGLDVGPAAAAVAKALLRRHWSVALRSTVCARNVKIDCAQTNVGPFPFLSAHDITTLAPSCDCVGPLNSHQCSHISRSHYIAQTASLAGRYAATSNSLLRINCAVQLLEVPQFCQASPKRRPQSSRTYIDSENHDREQENTRESADIRAITQDTSHQHKFRSRGFPGRFW